MPELLYVFKKNCVADGERDCVEEVMSQVWMMSKNMYPDSAHEILEKSYLVHAVEFLDK